LSGSPYVRDPHSFHGRVEMRPFESAALAGNAAGDPHVREVPVYVPPGWDAPGARFPVVFLLAGFTGRGQGYLDTHPWKPGVALLFDRAVHAGKTPPAILVLPDCFTKLGGSQYVNSSYLGAYEDHVAHELTAFVDEHYPTAPGRRAVVGKSSGGFGALHLAMRHPQLFPVAASISGDIDFETCHAKSFTDCLRGLVRHDGDPARFLAAFAEHPDLSGGGHDVLSPLAMAACFSPNPEAALGFDLPFELHTGERIPRVWERWLAFDPLHACERYAESLKQLELLHLECGVMDEYDLQFGLRKLVRRLEALGVAHVHEEHEGSHRHIDHRYGVVLPKVIEALS
jgi:pimeloyl-ACP methyl ester carboxylesterase